METISKIRELTNEPGYLYSLALMLLNDLFYPAELAADINWQDKLSFQELTFLIGLIVGKEIDTGTFPTEQSMIEQVTKTHELFEKLHTEHTNVFVSKLGETGETIEGLEGKEREDMLDKLHAQVFGSGEMMTEPIFYSGSGAYDFQYLEMARRKYARDKAWLKENRGLDIETATQIAAKLKELSEHRARNLPKEQTFENFCASALKVFTFAKDDMSDFESQQIDALLDHFSLTPGSVNRELQKPGQFNELVARPIIELANGRYFLPISFTLAEAIYESPYYWMVEDGSYMDTASVNRGGATEEIAYELLKKVFSEDKVYKGIKVHRQSGARRKLGTVVSDIDVLAAAGNKAVVLQAKSKRMTQPSRAGDTEQLKLDFNAAIQSAYDQGVRCRRSILDKNNVLVNSDGEEIKLDESIDDVYVICLTIDTYPAVTHQVDVYLKKDEGDPYPVAVSVFDLEIMTFYLKDPTELLYYLRQRVNLTKYFKAGSEISLLAYHLNQKLFPRPKLDRVAITEDFAQLIDANYPFVTGHYPNIEATEKLHHKWRNEKFQRLIDEIKDVEDPGFVDAMFFLYDMAGESADMLTKHIEKLNERVAKDGSRHDFSMLFEKGKSGLTYYCQAGNPATLGKNLLTHSIARKYKTKADVWLGIGSIALSGRIADAVVFSKEPWIYDEDLEKLQKVALKEGVTLDKEGEKLGRNDPCYCGSGKKYKKCCGQ